MDKLTTAIAAAGKRQRKRRRYAFLAVFLGVFLAAMATIGTLKGGFASGQPASPDSFSTPEQKAAALAAVQAADEQLKEAARGLATTAREVEALQAERRDVVEIRLAQLIAQRDSLAANSPELGSAAGSINSPMPAEKPRMVINPRWQQFNSEIGDLKRQRVELLETLTAAHPRVQALDLAIADVERQRANTPETIAAEAEPTSPTNSDTSVSTPPPAAIAAQQQRLEIEAAITEAQQQARGITDRLKVAEQKHTAALVAKQTAWELQAAAAMKNSLLAILPDEPPVEPGANPRTAIFTCSVLALLAAVFVSRKAKASETIFQSPAELRQTLELPVLGVLSFDAADLPRETPSRESKWVRRSVLAAEVFIAATVLLIGTLAAIDSRFMVNLLGDPLAACSQKFF